MRTIIFLAAILLANLCGWSQPAKKPKEKPPTQNEMESLMKEAQKMMDGMSPQNKKTMDSMGIKMPSFNNIPKSSDKELANAYADEGVVIPRKNTQLIATIPTGRFSAIELLNYVKKINTDIASIIKPGSKQMADQVIEAFKKDKYAAALSASAANGMWMAGYKEAGVYLMGKVIEMQPNAHNYNNYAAYLTMMGAAHKAIPLLNTLNSIHRKNSTILNNLAQAWLQLGDEDKATKYLDTTIMIYACHPQANFTKCLMLESKGRIAEAIAALKQSMKHSVTKAKTNKLRQLEGKGEPRKGYHIPQVYVSSTFNLGIYTDMIPTAYAKSAGTAEENQWKGFREQLNEEKQRLESRRATLQSTMNEEGEKIANALVKQKGVVFPPYYYQAVERYGSYLEGMRTSLRKEATDGVEYAQQWAKWKTDFRTDITAEKERYKKLEMEAGTPLPPDCAGEIPIVKRYIGAINDLNMKHNQDVVNKLTKDTYQNFYYATAVATTDAAALKVVLDLKIGFLQKLLELKHEYYDGIACEEQQESVFKRKELTDYDEVHCNILNTISFPGFGSVVMRCNNMSMYINSKLLPFSGSLTANFDGYVEQASLGIKLKAVELDAGAQFDKDGNFVKGNGSISTEIKGIEVKATGEVSEKGFTKGSIELGIDGELKFLPETLDGEAPVEISLKDQLGCGIEISGDGMTDFFVKNSVSGDFASNVEKSESMPSPSIPSIKVSADNEWSVNSGFSVTKGSLSGLK